MVSQPCWIRRTSATGVGVVPAAAPAPAAGGGGAGAGAGTEGGQLGTKVEIALGVVGGWRSATRGKTVAGIGGAAAESACWRAVRSARRSLAEGIDRARHLRPGASRSGQQGLPVMLLVVSRMMTVVVVVVVAAVVVVVAARGA